MQIQIRQIESTDEAAFLAASARSVALHGDWVSAPQNSEAFQTLLRKCADGRNASFLVTTGADELAGCINVNEIVRGAFQSAYLGYYAFAPHQCAGTMRAGLGLVIAHAFTKMQLHRLEANIQPDNTRSISLVESLGFRREGLSPRYLKIAGQWRDHLRYALTIEDWEARARE